MNYEVCDAILGLWRRLEDMSRMWEQVRIYGWAKLRVVASVVRPETQDLWIENLQRTSKKGLEEIVRVYKKSMARRERRCWSD